ncbi:hypothetical protein CAPTEDRAFT_185024 [Capitella teleta]|uniref:Uncharacterized protein n=1 Tax=Capitella teleta TaxID=283909 RepID=R7TAR6_CAPTE|nr:hypothetical protein CAPTEDRAFT_185024 [Capitella teleta]|eukprot:ELT88582.1 hypothetical protein CAPTEDRAFT_185024 [Capitella teleta]
MDHASHPTSRDVIHIEASSVIVVRIIWLYSSTKFPISACLPIPGHDDNCEANGHFCESPNSECDPDTGKCVCEKGYHKQENQCISAAKYVHRFIIWACDLIRLSSILFLQREEVEGSQESKFMKLCLILMCGVKYWWLAFQKKT